MSDLLDEVENMIDTLAVKIISVSKTSDPYWEHSARTLFKCLVWWMLEEIENEENPITECTFTFKTLIHLYENLIIPFSEYEKNCNFTTRSDKLKSKILYNSFPKNAKTTRDCIFSTFNEKMAPFRDISIKRLTSGHTINFQDLIDRPTIIYITYRDEVKISYDLISYFIQDAYSYLISYATNKKSGALDIPFYFILDEFGNLPQILNFDTVISCCAGRGIYFILIIQSYSQLENNYGHQVAAIIKDNLNVHIFMGSNNTQTNKMFSEECGRITRISPTSALNGNGNEISSYSIENIPAIPVSELTHFEEGECIITEANSGYVLYSKLERYYKCEEYANLKETYESDYICPLDTRDSKFDYKVIIRSEYDY